MSDVEFESDSFELVTSLNKLNYDLDLGLALSKSLNNKEDNILNPEEVNDLFNYQLRKILDL